MFFPLMKSELQCVRALVNILYCRHTYVSVCNQVAVPALGQLRPPPKTSRGAPLSASKMEGKDGFTQNAIFIRFCISCIFVRFLMNESDGYVFSQNPIASDFASSFPSLKPTHVF